MPNPTLSYILGINITVTSSSLGGIITIRNRANGDFIQAIPTNKTATKSTITIDLLNLKQPDGNTAGTFLDGNVLDITCSGEFAAATTHTIDTSKGGATITFAPTAVTSTTHPSFTL